MFLFLFFIFTSKNFVAKKHLFSGLHRIPMVLPVTSQNLPMTSQHNVDAELKECGTKKLQSAVNVIKTFFLLATMNRNNKLERLSQASLSNLV
jgi:hypothetical protein